MPLSHASCRSDDGDVRLPFFPLVKTRDAVSKDAPGGTERSDQQAGDGRLDSWKEIAAFLKRDVTTVRRWEKREGLPVHRHAHDIRDSVYAYTKELDDWRLGRHNHLVEAAAIDGGPAQQRRATDRPRGPSWPGLRPRFLRFPPPLWPSFSSVPHLARRRTNGARFGYPSC